MRIFFNLALAYSSLVLFLLPIFGCSFINCKAYDNSISVSGIISAEPLATAYAFFGGIFLLCIIYFQTTKKNLFRFVMAFLGGKFLGVPLIIPLGSVSNDWYHISFAGAGFVLQFVLGLAVLYDCFSTKITPKGTGTLAWSTFGMFVGIVLGLFTFYPQASNGYVVYTLVFAEYLLGVCLVVSAKAIDLYSL